MREMADMERAMVDHFGSSSLHSVTKKDWTAAWQAGRDWHARTAGGDAGEVARLKELAEYARSQALLLNHGCDDYALQDAILEALSQILGPLPGDAALAPTGGDGSSE